MGALTTPVGSNLGLPGLGLSTSGSAQTVFTHYFNFAVGLDAGGFYLDTALHPPSYQIRMDITLPSFNEVAMLSQLRFMVSDNSTNPTRFTAFFNVALTDPGGDGRLRSVELNGDLVEATLNGTAAVHLKLASNLGDAVLPDLATDLDMNWTFSLATVDTAAGNAGFGDRPSVVSTST